MANNLHISYDLIAPEKNYENVIAAVQSLGAWAKVHKSFWYVRSSYSSAEAIDIIRKAADKNDKIYVVDATNNNAHWANLSEEAAAHIHKFWRS